jgi:hypothetical protein
LSGSLGRHQPPNWAGPRRLGAYARTGYGRLHNSLSWCPPSTDARHAVCGVLGGADGVEVAASVREEIIKYHREDGASRGGCLCDVATPTGRIRGWMPVGRLPAEPGCWVKAHQDRICVPLVHPRADGIDYRGLRGPVGAARRRQTVLRSMDQSAGTDSEGVSAGQESAPGERPVQRADGAHLFTSCRALDDGDLGRRTRRRSGPRRGAGAVDGLEPWERPSRRGHASPRSHPGGRAQQGCPRVGRL